LTKRFGAATAVDCVDFAVPSGAFLVLVGPSGCGKSTLLRMLAGLDTPTDGEIAYGGRVVSSGNGGIRVTTAERDAGLVFQSYALWPHMTVAGNIDWPLQIRGVATLEREATVRRVASLLGIDGLLDRFPNQISGGQQQRVAIARTIAPAPSILLFDEPLSNLDAKLRVEMRAELLRIHRATGATSVYVTHDQVEAMTMATHVAVMNGGRIEQFGAPLDLLRRPATAFVATFLGTPPATLLTVTASGDGYIADGIRCCDAAIGRGAEQAQVLYRAHDVTVGRRDGAIAVPAVVEECAPMAGQTMVTARIGTETRITGIVDGWHSLDHGQAIDLSLPPHPALIYDMKGALIV
jgi:iron(III) transport system ATP-binding protein